MASVASLEVVAAKGSPGLAQDGWRDWTRLEGGGGYPTPTFLWAKNEKSDPAGRKAGTSPVLGYLAFWLVLDPQFFIHIFLPATRFGLKPTCQILTRSDQEPSSPFQHT